MKPFATSPALTRTTSLYLLYFHRKIRFPSVALPSAGLLDREKKILEALRSSGSRVIASSQRARHGEDLVFSWNFGSKSNSLTLPMGNLLAPVGVFIPLLGLIMGSWTNVSTASSKTAMTQLATDSFSTKYREWEFTLSFSTDGSVVLYAQVLYCRRST